jgi:voltage-gated potassium channel
MTPNAILEGLPRSLSQEIMLHLNRDLINKVAIFKGADELFIREAVQLLRPRVFLPDEYIIRQGEFGDCMYFLTSGEVLVLVDNQLVARLGPGSPFGETALVELVRRTATVFSTGYCTGYQLDKADFDSLRAKYPEFDQHMQAINYNHRAKPGNEFSAG